MDTSIIISRYNENLNWLDNYKDLNLIIYNKGLNNVKNKFNNLIEIPNVGRESHTWLFHIIQNYNNLTDVNIFLQGRIDDLGCMSFQSPIEYIKNTKKYGFAVKRFGLLGPLHWKDYLGIEKDPRYKKEWFKGDIATNSKGFRKFSKKYFPNIPIFVATSYGGCFGVTKEKIRRYELSFYKTLIKELEYHQNPIEGHFMERLWCYMFTENKFFLRSTRDVFLTKFERLFLRNKYKLNK